MTTTQSHRPPQLNELPTPPQGKSGWPWTEASPSAPETLPDGSPWPKISVVTPSYQQGQFLEETLRSVLLQGYSNLEYFVMDGGSADGSKEIIEKYAPWINAWQSAPDRGQSDAINQGFAQSTGELWGWLNSDDSYLPGALHAHAQLACQRPEAVLYIGASELLRVDEPASLGIGSAKGFLDLIDPYRFTKTFGVQQPAMLWRSKRAKEIGPLNEDNHMTMDIEFLLKLLCPDHQVACMETPTARFRFHPDQKTSDYLTVAFAILETQNAAFKIMGDQLAPDDRLTVARHLKRHRAQLLMRDYLDSGKRKWGSLLRSIRTDWTYFKDLILGKPI